MTKTDVFQAYGDNADDALRNWAQIDPAGFAHFESTALSRQYIADYRRWASRQVASIAVDAIKPKRNEPRLFPLDIKTPQVEIRKTVVHDGHELNLRDLAGTEGAAVLRQVALRDLGPAQTTASRCQRQIELADFIEAESVRLGRPVSVGEALGMEKAA